jgi:hypothetical protein
LPVESDGFRDAIAAARRSRFGRQLVERGRLRANGRDPGDGRDRP